jgi:hypothetical protein
MSLSIGLIHEGKIPSDSRVALTPKQCRFLKYHLSLEILVQHSPTRCYSDEEYLEYDIPVVEDVSAADILIGIKEVPIDQLIADKTYLFFSHTIKKQAHNRKLLRRILEQKIRLIDYEVVVDDQGERLIAFGYYAGLVGAHNGMFAYANRNGLVLRRMHEFQHYEDIKAYYQTLNWPAIKVVVTGTGRVATGAVQVLLDMGLCQVSPQEYLSQQYNYPVFTQLGCKDYVARISDGAYDKKEFYASPELYHSTFGPYAEVSDVFINGIYWDPKSPAFFTVEQMQDPKFNLKTIADVTCDIAPASSIPSTLFASKIADPVFGFNPLTGLAETPYQAHVIDMMTVDNLPNELPRDASEYFGTRFCDVLIPELIRPQSDIIDRATMTLDGKLTAKFNFLTDYVEG